MTERPIIFNAEMIRSTREVQSLYSKTKSGYPIHIVSLSQGKNSLAQW